MLGGNYLLRVVRYCNRLPREVVDDLSLKVFKARMDGVLNSLIQWLATLPPWPGG